MYEPDFWASSAEAMELSIEGNRLIAREIAILIRDLWQRSIPRLAFSITASSKRLFRKLRGFSALGPT